MFVRLEYVRLSICANLVMQLPCDAYTPSAQGMLGGALAPDIFRVDTINTACLHSKSRLFRINSMEGHVTLWYTPLAQLAAAMSQ